VAESRAAMRWPNAAAWRLSVPMRGVFGSRRASQTKSRLAAHASTLLCASPQKLDPRSLVPALGIPQEHAPEEVWPIKCCPSACTASSAVTRRFIHKVSSSAADGSCCRQRACLLACAVHPHLFSMRRGTRLNHERLPPRAVEWTAPPSGSARTGFASHAVQS
jgi:hypothetical protein